MLRNSILVSLALALGGGAASADSVDWSQYIDHNAKTSPAPPSSPPPVVTSASSSKASKHKAVAAKPKAAKKRGARRKH